ncbi:MAG: UDP-2,3-diacylglucosamine diphosphatase [Ignavibacteriae bacterium]|nr:UDP-2,3-diacylglucosamine diphosphatase [Ignavibacteriota bacterium]
MSGVYYFISDVHLGMAHYEHPREQEDAVLDFLGKAGKDAAEIFIVGDLFDSWIEYRQVVQKGHYRVLAKIYELVKSGVLITYLSGNHDFWRGSYFKDEFGIEIRHVPLEREIEGKRFYLHHGDGLAYNDTGYKILKKILRSSVSQFLYSLIHPDIGVWLAKRTSSKSRDYTTQKDYSPNDGLKDYAVKKISGGMDFVIMGHQHKPVMEYCRSGTFGGYYINLGNWIRDFSYGIFKNGKFSLRKFYDLKNNKVVEELISESK